MRTAANKWSAGEKQHMKFHINLAIMCKSFPHGGGLDACYYPVPSNAVLAETTKKTNPNRFQNHGFLNKTEPMTTANQNRTHFNNRTEPNQSLKKTIPCTPLEITEKTVVDNAVFRLSISSSVPEIFAIKVWSWPKSRQILDGFSLENFRDAGHNARQN